MGIHVATELLVTENSQTFLERQLEPISAGNTVSSPVVKVFMTNLGGLQIFL
jgi:hypothetical protein